MTMAKRMAATLDRQGAAPASHGSQATVGHVRMPGYIRGKQGVVVAVSPPYPFPDAAAHNMQVTEKPTYDVRFRSLELWPDSADEAFQSYLERTG